MHIPEFPWLKHSFITMKNNTIEKLQNCSQRPLFLIVEGDTEFDAIKKAKIIEKALEIRYE